MSSDENLGGGGNGSNDAPQLVVVSGKQSVNHTDRY